MIPPVAIRANPISDVSPMSTTIVKLAAVWEAPILVTPNAIAVIGPPVRLEELAKWVRRNNVPITTPIPRVVLPPELPPLVVLCRGRFALVATISPPPLNAMLKIRLAIGLPPIQELEEDV